MQHTHTTTVFALISALILASGAAAAERAREVDGTPFQILPAEISAEEEAAMAHAKSFGGAAVVTIPAAAFGHDGSDADSFRFEENFGYLRRNGSATYCGQAPVYLPHGAVVTQLWASVLDFDGTADVTITLSRSEHAGYQSSDQLASISTSSLSPAIQKPNTSSITNAQVDLGAYSYFLTTCLSANLHYLYSVRIFYDETEIFVDGFESGGVTRWSSSAGAAAHAARPSDHGQADISSEVVSLTDQELPPKLAAAAKSYGPPLVVPAADFHHNGVWPSDLQDSPSGYIDAAGFGTSYAQAPAHLPDGAVVSEVYAVVYDKFDELGQDCSAYPDVDIWLYRGDNSAAGSSPALMTHITTSGSDNLVQYLPNPEPIANATVAYPEYQYFLTTRMCSVDHRLYAVLIFYTQP